MAKPRRENYLVRRAVKRQLQKLGLLEAERVLVKVCCTCPCCSEHDHGSIEYHCTMLAERQLPNSGNDSPPHDCPLRERALSVAIDPEV